MSDDNDDNDFVNQEIDVVLAMVREQLVKAIKKHPKPFHSLHEGWAVIYEEYMHEMTPEVFRQQVDPVALAKETLHTAAMAVRFILDLLR